MGPYPPWREGSSQSPRKLSPNGNSQFVEDGLAHSRTTDVIFVIALIVAVVGADVLFFRHDIVARLTANVGIVLAFVVFYLVFLRHR
jgi:hypothetical protein